MSFSRYPKISNIKGALKPLEHLQLVWCAQEKVHGSNASIYLNKEKQKYGYCTRNQDITNGDFHGLQKIATELKPNIEQLYDELLISYPSIKQITIFGELFGGYAPGTTCNVSAIQKGIVYSPDIHFLLFDIKLFYDDDKTHFISVSECNSYCKSCNIPMVPTIKQGSLEELLNLNPVFESTIHTLVGFENVPKENFAEGYIIRPESGNLYIGCDRAILKLKHKRFTESNEESGTNYLTQMVTVNRLDNIRSKTVEELKENELTKEMFKDILEEANKTSISKRERKKLDLAIRKLIRTNI